MDIYLKQYYDDRFEMFSTKGWKDLIEDVLTIKETVKDVSNCTDEQSLFKAKGELSMINWILSLEEVSSKAFGQLADDASL